MHSCTVLIYTPPQIGTCGEQQSVGDCSTVQYSAYSTAEEWQSTLVDWCTVQLQSGKVLRCTGALVYGTVAEWKSALVY